MTDCWDPKPEKRPNMAQVIARLESIMIESQLSSPKARAFWKKYFTHGGLKTSTSWDSFKSALSRETGVTLEQMAETDIFAVAGGLIELSHFDILQKWFGDFYVPENAFIIHEMNALGAKRWFAPFATKEQAESWLNNRENGLFLVRLSTGQPTTDPFTISRRKNGDKGLETIHRRIRRASYDNKNERYAADTADNQRMLSPDVVRIIDELIRRGELTVPCPHQAMGGGYT